MRYDFSSIYLLRNPYGDESLVDIVRAAAVYDSSQRVGSLVRCIDMPELAVDHLSPDADIASHFAKYLPDILIVPTELLGGETFAKLFYRLRNISQRMPYLITVGLEPDDLASENIDGFRGYLHIGDLTDCFSGAETIRRFIIREVIDHDYLTYKLRKSAELTLTAMHAEHGEGFEYLLDEVTEVLENNFVFFGSAAALHRRISELRGIPASTIESAVSSVVENAILRMTDSEYTACFEYYISRGITPGTMEFIYSAAKLTSGSCWHLLQYLYLLPTGNEHKNSLYE